MLALNLGYSQVVRHVTLNHRRAGSIPATPAKKKQNRLDGLFFCYERKFIS